MRLVSKPANEVSCADFVGGLITDPEYAVQLSKPPVILFDNVRLVEKIESTPSRVTLHYSSGEQSDFQSYDDVLVVEL